MKNITLAVDDQTWKAARIAAAERGKSLSALVREFLQGLRPSRDTHKDDVRRMFAAMDAVKSPFSAGDRLSRDKVHDRRRVR
ncbi:MAG: hypothetical protein K8T20_07090 [Planctomycetes bacterium]|nr:hypothetical protein [Planctomycetota bacterium]